MTYKITRVDLTRSGISFRRQIIHSIINAIRRGDLKEYQPLPTTREWADICCISQFTVLSAYQVLRRMGYIIGGPGRPYRVEEFI